MSLKRLQASHVIKVRSFGGKLVNSIDKVKNFVQHGKVAKKFILARAPGRHILRYKAINNSTKTAGLHPRTYGLHSKKMVALSDFTTIPYELNKSSNIGKATTTNQCRRVPELWRPGSVKIKRYYAKNGRLIPTAKRGKKIKQP